MFPSLWPLLALVSGLVEVPTLEELLAGPLEPPSADAITGLARALVAAGASGYPTALVTLYGLEYPELALHGLSGQSAAALREHAGRDLSLVATSQGTTVTVFRDAALAALCQCDDADLAAIHTLAIDEKVKADERFVALLERLPTLRRVRIEGRGRASLWLDALAAHCPSLAALSSSVALEGEDLERVKGLPLRELDVELANASVVKSIGHFDLERLSLLGNHFAISLPARRLEGLTELTLTAASLKGDVLPPLPRLREVTLGGAISPRLAERIGACPALEKVDLATNLPLTILERILAAPALTSLHVGGIPIDDATAAILAARPLTVLEAAGQDLNDAGITALVGSTSLRNLALPSAKLAPHHLALAFESKLRSFAAEGLGRVGAFEADGSRSALRVLSISGTALGPDGLAVVASMPRLRVLKARRNSIDAVSARALAGARSLRVLDTSTSDLGPAAAVALSKLGTLVTLQAEKCGFGDEGARALGALDELRDLDVTKNGIGPAGAPALFALPKLRRLVANGNSLGDLPPAAARRLPNLVELRLTGAGLTDASAATLLTGKKLRTLSLSNNALAESTVRDLAKLPALDLLSASPEEDWKTEEMIAEAVPVNLRL